MVDISLFSIPTSRLKLGAVLARGSPGITLYQAELQLRKYVTKVCLTCLLEPLSIQAAFTGMCPAVAVKKLQTGSAPAAVEAAFLEEVQTLQLASAFCQQACRTLGCCKVDGDACIVMSLYPKSAAKRLEESQGWSWPAQRLTSI